MNTTYTKRAKKHKMKREREKKRVMNKLKTITKLIRYTFLNCMYIWHVCGKKAYSCSHTRMKKRFVVSSHMHPVLAKFIFFLVAGFSWPLFFPINHAIIQSIHSARKRDKRTNMHCYTCATYTLCILHAKKSSWRIYV